MKHVLKTVGLRIVFVAVLAAATNAMLEIV
jgi:hypothetical protein